jgi:hypothetical protein
MLEMTNVRLQNRSGGQYGQGLAHYALIIVILAVFVVVGLAVFGPIIGEIILELKTAYGLL